MRYAVCRFLHTEHRPEAAHPGLRWKRRPFCHTMYVRCTARAQAVEAAHHLRVIDAALAALSACSTQNVRNWGSSGGGLDCVLGHARQSSGRRFSWSAAVHCACVAALARQLLHSGSIMVSILVYR